MISTSTFRNGCFVELSGLKFKIWGKGKILLLLLDTSKQETGKMVGT